MAKVSVSPYVGACVAKADLVDMVVPPHVIVTRGSAAERPRRSGTAGRRPVTPWTVMARAGSAASPRFTKMESSSPPCSADDEDV